MNNKVLQAIVEIAGNVSPTLQKAIVETCEKLDKVNLKAVAVAGAAAAGAVAIGKAVIEGGKYLADLGDEYNQAMNDVSAMTGAVGEELEALGDVVKTVYADNFGDSMQDAAAAVAEVERVLDLEGDALAKATESAIALSDTFEYGVNESSRTASALMKNFGIDAEEAYNLIAVGAQNGADQNGDLLDTLNEYAAQYSALGLSADQFVQGLIEAGDTGVFSIDKVGDAVKEFNIRSKDLSDSSAEAYEQLGMDATEMFQRFAAGGETANEAFFEVVKALEGLDDPVAKNSAAVALFGTMYEDLGKDILPILSSMEGATLDNVDALAQINQVKYNDLGSALEGIKRQAEVALLPLASTIANSLMQIAPIVGDLFEAIEPVIVELTATLTPLIEDIVAEIGPMLKKLVPPIAKIVSEVAKKLLPPLIKIIGAVLPVLIELAEMLLPIIEFIAADVLPAIVNIIEALLPVVLQIIDAVLPIIISLLESLMPLLSQIIDAILPVVIDLIDQLLPIITEIIEAVLPIVVSLLEALLPIISRLITELLPPITKILSALLPIVTQIIEAILPIVIQLLDVLTPILDLVISLLGPILDLIVQLVAPILNLIATAIGPLISIISTLISAVLEPLKPLLQIVADLFTNSLGSAIANIQPVITALTGVFNGLISFIQNVFAGNWRGAWDGIVQVFKNVWDGVVAIFKAPINWIIDGINSFLGGLNKIKIPDWVPGVGGKGLNIPLIPKLATGGFTDGISIAGEAGMEAVISFDPAYHEENVGYWQQAGKLLGVLDEVDLNAGAQAATAATIQMAEAETGAKETPQITQAGKLMELDDFSLGQLTETTIIYYDFSGFSYAPQVEAGADADKEDIVAALKEQASEFFDWLEEWLRQKEVGDYDRVSIY